MTRSLKTVNDQTNAIATIVHTNLRTSSYYRDAAMSHVNGLIKARKVKRDKVAMKRAADNHLIKLFRADLERADSIMDAKLQRYADTVASEMGVGKIAVDLDWPKMVGNPTFRTAELSALDVSDPINEKIVGFVKSEIAEIEKLSINLRTSHARSKKG